MGFLWANNGKSQLAGNLSAGATSVTIAAGDGVLFPDPSGPDFFMATIIRKSDLAFEIVKVTSRTGDVFDVIERAQESTLALAFIDGDLIENRPTAGAFSGLATAADLQGSSATYAADTGSANAVVAAYTPAPTLGDGVSLMVNLIATNTGATTFEPNALGALPIRKHGGLAMEAGELVAGQSIIVAYDSAIPSWQLVSAINSPHPASSIAVGDFVFSLGATKTGFLLCRGQTVGSLASAAIDNSDLYEALFTFVWDNVIDTWAAVTGGRGASAAADWAADKIIALPDGRGRQLIAADNMGGGSAGVVTGTAADEAGGRAGDDTHTISQAEMRAHSHTGPNHAHNMSHTHALPGNNLLQGGGASGSTGGGGFDSLGGSTGGSPTNTGNSGTGNTSTYGSSSPMDIMNPYMTANLFIKY